MTDARTERRRSAPALYAAHAHAHEASPQEAATTHERPESLWALFRIVFGLSAVSWGGLALMAQLEIHYVDRERRFTRLEFSDLVALAWMVPGAVSCNVAVQVGHALRGRAGAWIAGLASVLPFFCTMSAFAVFYHTAFVRSLASPALLDHFAVVLAALIALTWYRQMRSLVRGPLEWGAAVLACAVLLYTHNAAAFVLLLVSAFASGWFASRSRDGHLEFSLSLADKLLTLTLTVLIALFAMPLSTHYQVALIWPRLAGAGMTLFGGGFSALPVLKTLFVTSALGVSAHDFTLAFALSPVSPGPLLNVVPFLGYLTQGWLGAVSATLALFVPSGVLIVLARRHLHRLEANARFEHGMRVLRAATTAFLVTAVVRVCEHVPFKPIYLCTAAFALVCLGRFKVPVYAVYASVALVYGVAVALGYR
ncbi:chromate transporter [Trinickia fusca]|uniref:Chromate transporter n=1 Tax=Trinickia fusca TaxID=2419777 RepID=A0A494X946_9BURK|nr:chromate transporter [Trinickia fusca]RKP44906.1 chromate transporter [Trinickia fusca]